MKKTSTFILLLALVALILYFIFPNITDVVTNPSAREIYEREFTLGNTQFVQWKNAAENAKKDSLEITLPFVESGQFKTSRNEVYSFNFEAKEGEIIFAEVTSPIDSATIFIGVFKYTNDSLPKLKKIIDNPPSQ